MKKKVYTVVGIVSVDLDNKLFNGKLIRLLTEEELKNKSQEFEAFTYLKDPSKVEELANNIGIRYIEPSSNMNDPFGYEASDVKYPGYDKEKYSSIMQNGVALSILCVIIGFCFIAIYNTFHASIAKKIKVYGILRALGGSMGQVGYLIYMESLILYLVSVPIGLFIGYFLTQIESYILVDILGMLDGFIMNFNLEVIIIALLSTLLIIIITVTEILRKEGKVTPIEAIMDARGLGKNKKSLGKNIMGQSLSGSGTDEDEIEAVKEILNYEKTTLKFKLMKRLFKFEGEMAHKNITGDASTYKLTKRTLFFAMAVLIFFFLQIVNDNVVQKGIEISDKWNVKLTSSENKLNENSINEIGNIKGVENMYRISEVKVPLVVDTDILSHEVKAALAEKTLDGKSKGITANITTIDENSVNLYGDINKEELDNGGVILVKKATNHRYQIDARAAYDIYFHTENVLTSKVGDKLLLSEDDTVLTNEGLKQYYKDNKSFKDISIVGTVDDDIIYSTYKSVNKDELDYNVKLLTTEEGLRKITEKPSKNKILLKVANNEERENTIRDLREISASKNYDLKDIDGDKLKLEKNTKEKIGLNIIFAITMIIMVVLNLVNTTNAVILSRRKELAGMRAIGMSNHQQMKMIVGEVFYVALSVAFTTIVTVGALSLAAQGVNIGAGKVSLLTIVVGECIIIISILLIATLTSVAPLYQANKYSIVESLKSE